MHQGSKTGYLFLTRFIFWPGRYSGWVNTLCISCDIERNYYNVVWNFVSLAWLSSGSINWLRLLNCLTATSMSNLSRSNNLTLHSPLYAFIADPEQFVLTRNWWRRLGASHIKNWLKSCTYLLIVRFCTILFLSSKFASPPYSILHYFLYYHLL
jgi:hypothetical protein